jgi:membrane protein
VIRDVAREWRDDRVSGLAGEIAFFGVLSLFPTMLALAAALGSMDAIFGRDVAQPVEDKIVELLQSVLTERASGTVDAVRRLFDETNAQALTVGALLALWSASRGFVAVINALDVAYDLTERRSYLRLRAVALLLALGSVVVASVMLAMLGVGPLFGSGRDLASDLALGRGFAVLWNWARWPLAVAVMLAWATMVFHVAPNHRAPWRWDLPGAVLATVSWSVLSIGFRVYLSLAGAGNEVLGTLGGALIVLLWLYLLGVGLLLGGELNSVLARRHHVRQLPRDRGGSLVALTRRAAQRIARGRE